MISDSEGRRLRQLLGEVKTVNDAIEKLGLPDVDSPDGVSVKKPETDGTAPSIRYYRTLTYRRLSETADVCLTVYPDDRVSVQFFGKPVSPPCGEGAPRG
jgi:hypothetical protein